MKKNKINIALSLVLCGLMAMPAYAGSVATPETGVGTASEAVSKESIKSKLSCTLGHAERGTKAAMWSVVILGGAVLCGASSYFGCWRSGRKLFGINGEGTKHPDKLEYAGRFGFGCVGDLAGLAIIGFGIRGLKRMLDGKHVEKTSEEKQVMGQDNKKEDEPEFEEHLEKAVNGAKKAAGFGARICGYSFLTVLGLAGTMIGVIAGVSHCLPIDDKINFRKASHKHIFSNVSKDRTGAFLLGSLIGLPAMTLGIRGLIRTCKKKKKAKQVAAVETNEVAVQTGGVGSDVALPLVKSPGIIQNV